MSKRRFFSPAEWEVLQYVVEHHPIIGGERNVAKLNARDDWLAFIRDDH